MLDEPSVTREQRAAARQPLVDRRVADAQRPRDVRGRLLLAVEQHERLAVRLGHARERGRDGAFELAFVERVEWRALARPLDVARRLAPQLPAARPRQVARDAAQPGRDPLAVAQLSELGPCEQERVLRDVLAVHAVAHRRIGDGTHGALVPLDERAERGGVTGARGSNQVSVRSHVAL